MAGATVSAKRRSIARAAFIGRGGGAFGQLVEVLVDFDKTTADMVEDITPVEYRWAA